MLPTECILTNHLGNYARPLKCLNDQGGKSQHGWVVFPIRYTKFRSAVTNHQGVTYMNSRVEEFNSLDGMTLKVGDNYRDTEDAQWITVGI